jgi:antitoxin ParD1/3/4
MTVRQSITLTSPNDAWLSAMVESGEYHSKSDVMNVLIRKERARRERIEYIRSQLIEAEQSGFVEDIDPERMLAEFKASI